MLFPEFLSPLIRIFFVSFTLASFSFHYKILDEDRRLVYTEKSTQMWTFESFDRTSRKVNQPSS